MPLPQKLFTAASAEPAEAINRVSFSGFRVFCVERLLLLFCAAMLSQACLVVSLQPAYDDESLAWDDGLVGQWRDAEDNVEVTVTRGEWRSYRVHYKHPVEEADFTGRLTVVGDTHFLDLMPAKGLDYGAVLIPAHLVVRISRDRNQCQVWSLDYEALRAALKAGRLARSVATVDQRQNLVLTSSTEALRDWLRTRTEKDFDAPAIFERTNP